MQRYKFGFWPIFVLVLGLCAILWASDKNASIERRLNWMKNSSLLQKGARAPFPASGGISEPPNLWVSQKPQEPPKVMAGTGAISGHVTKLVGGAAIPGVMIIADQLACPSYSSFAFSGFDGFYVITNLPPGMYRVNTSNMSNDSNFVDIWWENSLNEETADTVPVVTNDTTENVNFSLRVGAKITGTITLTGLSYVTGISVHAIDTLTNDYYTDQPVSLHTGSATYTIKRLPTGKYKLKTYNPYLGYVDEYYDDTSTWASATTISVIEGSTYSGKDITLDKGAIIEGTVSGTYKVPLEDVQLRAYYVPDKLEWVHFGYTDENGEYSITGLRSGDWKIFCYGDLTFAWEWYNDASSWNGATAISVTDTNTYSNKDFSLEVGGVITGHVYDQGSNPLFDCDVYAFDTSYVGSGQGIKGTQTEANGYYEVGGLRPASYYVEASTECSNQFYDHASTMQEATLVNVTMPSEYSGIDFNLSTAVEDEEEIDQRPSEFELYQNYPNPFNPETKIEYTLKKTGHVTLYIYNILGEKVKTLLDQDQPAGLYRIDWDGKNDNGKFVPSGLYLYKLEVNGFSEAKRMLLLK
jgi:hypothetical protein